MLAACWTLVPGPSPPLYDGLCLVNPYQSFPAQPGKPAATDAVKTLDVSGGEPATELITGETPPQAILDLGESVLDIPAGISSIRLTITPVTPPSIAPGDGRIDGNVYRIVASTDRGAPINLRSGATGEVLLRPTSENPSVSKVIERLDGDRWTRLDTAPMNCADTQSAVTRSLGDFAIVVPGGSPPAAPEGGGAPVGLILVGALVLVLGAVIGLVRVGRARR